MKELSFCPNGELITRTEKLVALILGDAHQDRRDRYTFPSIDEMKGDAMLSERQFLRCLDALERKGVIRREYPSGRGRGKTTYYIFPELVREGCQDVTLSIPGKGDRRVTEGCHKGDKTTPLHMGNKSNKSNESNEKLEIPQPLFAKGESVSKSPTTMSVPGGAAESELEIAVDQVMHGCGFVRKRLRKTLKLVIERERDKGQPRQTVALAMIAAWTNQTLNSHLLRFPYGPEKFFGDGHWRNPDGWHWDKEAIDRNRNARVGT